jgi:pimeloyl-ACP methyl ester carboxylesterase
MICAGDFSISVHFLNARHNSGRMIHSLLDSAVPVPLIRLDRLRRRFQFGRVIKDIIIREKFSAAIRNLQPEVCVNISMKLLPCALFLFGCVSALFAQSDGSTLVNSGVGTVEMAISGSHRPAVVFESGFSDNYDYWGAAVAAVSAKAETVRYNRAGIGRSPLNDLPRTAEEIAKELHTALSNAKVMPPYILVGHSAGGMYVREFAYLFPGDVAGIVLVDPAPEAFYGMLAQDPTLWKSMMEQLKEMPPAAKAQMDVNTTTVDELKAAWPLPHVPVVVISATKIQPPIFTAEQRREVTSLQTALVGRIRGAQHIEATGCGHNIPGECPSVVSKAVLTMLVKLSK